MYDFGELEKYIASFESIGIPMADVKVMIDHEEVFHKGAGYSDAARTKKRMATIFCGCFPPQR